MYFDLTVAFRFLREGRYQTLLIVVGIAVGIAVQVFLNALITGLQKDLVRRTVGAASHITATVPDRAPTAAPWTHDSVVTAYRIAGTDGIVRPIRDWQSVVSQIEQSGAFTAVSPSADGAAFVFQGERSRPVTVRGIDLDRADRIYDIRSRVLSGRPNVSGNDVLVGRELAADLRLTPGSALRLTASNGTADVFTVSGVFDLEAQAINQTWVVMSLTRAQALFDLAGGVSSIETQVDDVFGAQALTEGLRRSFPALKWTSWQESNANLLQALRSQSSSSVMIQVLVLLAVTLGISSVLAVSSVQKAKQIGILKAIGATTGTISRIFLVQGSVLGFAGSLLGCLGGYGLLKGFLIGTAASTGKPLFPLDISASLYLGSIIIATVAGTLAASIPARRSARLNPIEVIRNG